MRIFTRLLPFLFSLPGWGGVVAYSDYATWAAAAGSSIQAVTFSNALPPGPYSSGVTVDGVFFEGLSAGAWNGYLYQTFAGYCGGSGCLVGPSTEAGALGATDGYIRASMSAPVYAIAFDAGVYHSDGDIPVFRFSNGDQYTGSNLLASPTFFGFITDTPFTYADYHISVGTSGGDATVLDTVYVPTPEPGTYALMAAGLFALALKKAVK